VSAPTRLFYEATDVERDVMVERRQRAQERAGAQSRCLSCGRFTPASGLVYGAVCRRCLEDKRPTIVRKVDQARRWWANVRRTRL
jgi:hypothetical protein